MSPDSSIPIPRFARGAWPYAAAVAISALFVLLRLAVEPVMKGQAPLIALLAAPLLTCWYFGFRPALLATVLSAAAGELLFVQPYGSLLPREPSEWLRLFIFVTYGVVFSWLIESRRTLFLRLLRERKDLEHARDEIAQREARLRDVLEAAPAGMLVVNRDGRIEMANGQASQLFGYAREELLNMPVEQLVPGPHRARHTGDRARYQADPSSRPMGMGRDLHGQRRDGSVFPVEIGLNPLPGGSAGLTLASVADISRRKQAEEGLHATMAKLKDTDLHFRALADNIAQLAWMADADGAIHWYNRRWFEYSGASDEQMRGWGWRAIHHPDHVQAVEAKFRRHIASGEPWEDTFPLRSASGEYRWFLSRAVPLRDEQGRVVRWFGTNTDVTTQREAEATLREADRRKDEFIAVLAHELRNPLAPVRTAVELLRRLGPPEPKLQRARDIIARQVSHMARLIDDLLDVSRIARGKLALQTEHCDLAAIVRDTTEDYRPTVEGEGHQLSLQVQVQPVWMEGDPVRLAQMLGNVLTNAVRFNQPQGRIDVRLEADAGQAVITVADTGVGIDADLLGRLFDPFAQASQDIARSKGGLGLGLALTKGLAELHGGTVAAESEGPGRGARFTLRLPLVQAGAPPQAESNPMVQTGGDGLRVLLVEDNHDTATTLGELLQMMGHQVTLAHDGQGGLDAARRCRPEVVISDIGLPGAVDGFALGRALRADPTLAGTHRIALSGYADEAARRRCLEAGFHAHIAKPPDLAELETVLAGIRQQRESGGTPAA